VAKNSDREPLVIIVEDDKNFADILHDFHATTDTKSVNGVRRYQCGRDHKGQQPTL